MTPKDKAREIVEKYHDEFGMLWYTAKQCSVIAVDEIIAANPHSNPYNTDVYSTMEYWQRVKNEIVKL